MTTATWLVDNTGLSFEQIAEFCGLHILEVQAMADDLAGSKYTGRDPVHSGELTLAEIEKATTAYPKYAIAWYDQGRLYEMQKRPADAQKAYAAEHVSGWRAYGGVHTPGGGGGVYTDWFI